MITLREAAPTDSGRRNKRNHYQQRSSHYELYDSLYGEFLGASPSQDAYHGLYETLSKSRKISLYGESLGAFGRFVVRDKSSLRLKALGGLLVTWYALWRHLVRLVAGGGPLLVGGWFFPS